MKGTERRLVVMRHELGGALTDIVVVLSLVGLIALLGIPHLQAAMRSAELHTVEQQLRGMMSLSRAHAIAISQATGLVFEQDDQKWHCYIAMDGNGDGINRQDLAGGEDRRVSEVLQLGSGQAGLGILQDQPVPEPGGGWLSGDLDDPVRGGGGNIITFSPTGTATPCSIYLTDFHQRMRVIRVFGSSARSLVWTVRWQGWRKAGIVTPRTTMQ